MWILTIQFFECLNVAAQALCATYLGKEVGRDTGIGLGRGRGRWWGGEGRVQRVGAVAKPTGGPRNNLNKGGCYGGHSLTCCVRHEACGLSLVPHTPFLNPNCTPLPNPDPIPAPPPQDVRTAREVLARLVVLGSGVGALAGAAVWAAHAPVISFFTADPTVFAMVRRGPRAARGRAHFLPETN